MIGKFNNLESVKIKENREIRNEKFNFKISDFKFSNNCSNFTYQSIESREHIAKIKNPSLRNSSLIAIIYTISLECICLFKQDDSSYIITLIDHNGFELSEEYNVTDSKDSQQEVLDKISDLYNRKYKCRSDINKKEEEIFYEIIGW